MLVFDKVRVIELIRQEDTQMMCRLIRYSTNYMGPVHTKWFTDRGIKSGDESWAGGRIDIYGLDRNDYYDGRGELGLPIMDGESWFKLTDWLAEYKTQELKTLEELLSDFYADTNHTIQWASEVFKEIQK